MKRAAIIIAVLGISVWGFARTLLGRARQAGGAERAAAGQAAAPAGKRPPQAKTQDEFAAYKAADGVDRSRGAGESGERFRGEVSGQRVAALAL